MLLFGCKYVSVLDLVYCRFSRLSYVRICFSREKFFEVPNREGMSNVGQGRGYLNTEREVVVAKGNVESFQCLELKAFDAVFGRRLHVRVIIEYQVTFAAF